jgi:hypothetical protein
MNPKHKRRKLRAAKVNRRQSTPCPFCRHVHPTERAAESCRQTLVCVRWNFPNKETAAAVAIQNKTAGLVNFFANALKDSGDAAAAETGHRMRKHILTIWRNLQEAHMVSPGFIRRQLIDFEGTVCGRWNIRKPGTVEVRHAVEVLAGLVELVTVHLEEQLGADHLHVTPWRWLDCAMATAHRHCYGEGLAAPSEESFEVQEYFRAAIWGERLQAEPEPVRIYEVNSKFLLAARGRSEARTFLREQFGLSGALLDGLAKGGKAAGSAAVEYATWGELAEAVQACDAAPCRVLDFMRRWKRDAA